MDDTHLHNSYMLFDLPLTFSGFSCMQLVRRPDVGDYHKPVHGCGEGWRLRCTIGMRDMHMHIALSMLFECTLTLPGFKPKLKFSCTQLVPWCRVVVDCSGHFCQPDSGW